MLAKLRERIKGLVMRTTFITGFPGETDEQFEELVDFVQSSGSSGWGCSPIRSSPTRRRPGCPIICRGGQRKPAATGLMAVQQEIAFAWNEAQIGRRFDVLIDRAVPGEKNAWIGRSYADAPDVDGVVYVSGANLRSGKLVRCEIVATSDYDLVGVAVGKPR